MCNYFVAFLFLMGYRARWAWEYQRNTGQSNLVNKLLLFVLFAVSGVAQAANVGVTLSINPQITDRPTAVTVTWSSTGAGVCTASGGWSGGKSVTGTEVLPLVSVKTDYTLVCTSPTGPATLSWTPNLTFTDNTVMVPTGYQVMVGSTSANLARGPLLPPSPTSGVVIQAPPGAQIFTLRSEAKLNGVDVESVDSSPPVSKLVVADKATASVSLVFKILPNSPTDFKVE